MLNFSLGSNVPMDSVMTAASDNEITRALRAASQGDQSAAEKLLPLVYEELRRVARARCRMIPPNATLQPTALVHEAYLRLMGKAVQDYESRRHFFATAARAMRDILVEQARRKAALKRGGSSERVPLEQVEPTFESPDIDVLAVDEAVQQLERDDPRKGQIVNLRYFAGLTAEETAEALGVSLGTVEREWRSIRSHLQRVLAAS
jgi:RNA polymerase sigma factor (TIGR02999 family)